MYGYMTLASLLKWSAAAKGRLCSARYSQNKTSAFVTWLTSLEALLVKNDLIFRPQFEKLFVFVRVSVFFYVVFPPVIYGEISAADGTKCIALSLLTLMHKIIRFYPLIVEG